MPTEHRLYASLSTALVVIALTGPLAPQAQEQGYLEEIIVTAQKREQSIQDVPVAVTALSGEQLVDYGITDMFDLFYLVPGLVVDQSQSAGTANFAIRGVGTSAQNFGLESSVGLYVDNVYRPRQSSMVNELLDVERVEVLRGPQGTLFGRNTPSGAVSLSSVAPGHDTDGYLELTYGNLDLFSANGAFGGSLVEGVLAARVAGFTSNRDGYADALGFGNGLINDRDRMGGRAQLLYTPNEDLSLRLIVDYSETDEVCCAAATLYNSFFGFNYQPGSDTILALLGTPVIDASQVYDDVMAVSYLPRSKSEDKGISVELNWHTGAGTITSISAFRSADIADFIDADFAAADIVARNNVGDSDTFTQEVRFAGSAGEKLNYLVGAYYFTQDLNSDTSLTFGPHFEPFLLYGTPELAAVVDGINGLSAATGGLIPMAGSPFPPGSMSGDVMLQDHEAWALFGQLNYRVMEQFEFSAGLRYTDERKELLGTFTQDNTGPPPDLEAIGINLFLASLGFAPPDLEVLAPLLSPGWGFYMLPVFAPRPGVDESLEDDRITWNAKISWLPNNDMLLYAGYATGFKSGGTNTDRIHPAFSQLFDAETVEAFEAGAKLDFPAQKLRANLSLHYTMIDDYQVTAFTGTGFNLQNAGQLEAKGGELEVIWAPADNLLLNVAYVYNDLEYDEFERANCWVATPFQTGQPDPGRRNPEDQFCDRSGAPVAGNPKHNVIVSATGSWPLGANVTGYLQTDYSHASRTLRDNNADPLKFQNGFGLLNVRGGLVLESIGLSITAWARNVLDEDHSGAVFDVPLQDGKLNTYMREPRTFGATLRKQF